jgi:thiamine-phosphate pyrophosphorylase
MPAEGATTVDPRALALYVVTGTDPPIGRGHLDVARAALAGGASTVQLRAPELDDEDLLPFARSLAVLCAGTGARSIVNDRTSVSIEAGTDGVHLGQGDDLDGARRRLGPGRHLGISVADPDEARAAHAAGADYLGVTVWATTTKPGAVPVGLDGVRAVAAATPLPVVGIGGIDRTNARVVLAAGAAGVAVISAVLAAPDMVAAARELRAAVDDALEGRA